MTRRELSTLLGSLGMTGVGLRSLTGEAVADLSKNPSAEVPRLKALRHTNQEEIERGAAPKREGVYYTIPRADWANIEATFDAAARIAKRFRDPHLHFPVERDPQSHTNLAVPAEWTVRETADGEEHRPEIPFEEFERMVPSRAAGTAGSGDNAERRTNIPVDVRKARVTEANYYDTDYLSVPGGCREYTKYGAGTLCTPAYHWRLSETVLTTASHCVGREIGTLVHQPDCDGGRCSDPASAIGRCYYATPKGSGDAAAIQLDWDPEVIAYKIADDYGGYDFDVVGKLTDTNLKDKLYYGGGLNRQGQVSGREWDVLDSVDTSKDVTLVDLDTVSKKGDSGGPMFEITSSGDGAYIGAVAMGIKDGDKDGDIDTRGHSAEWMESALDVII